MVTAAAEADVREGAAVLSVGGSLPVSDPTAGMRGPLKEPIVWMWTSTKSVFTAAMEAGWDTFVFHGDEGRELASSWSSMAKFTPLFVERESGDAHGRSRLLTSRGDPMAAVVEVSSAADVAALAALSGTTQTYVMDAKDWQVIPSENLVAVFQSGCATLLAAAASAADAVLMLEALEVGTDGVVLRVEDAGEVFALKHYLAARGAARAGVPLQVGTVTRVEPVGMGDRACVDLCCLLEPGEGLLVGSFARALFLVHSECLEAAYVASRPFRVNAGPVHAYAAAPGGKTAYLSELRSGSTVLVVSARGRTRAAVVGRVKIESRPLVLVEAEVEGGGGQRCSLLLQNAETVRLVAPDTEESWGGRAVSVSELQRGDRVLLAVQGSQARHTGISVDEFITEK